jgi:hypothetical protein
MKSRIGLIVAISVAAGLIAAMALVAAPFVPAEANALTGVVLLGFAFGWALLAVLSVRFTDQPQPWAAAPATFMGVAGLVSLSGWPALLTVLSWVWPPVLFGLVVWMFLRVRRDMRSRIGRWLLYPVLRSTSATVGVAHLGKRGRPCLRGGLVALAPVPTHGGSVAFVEGRWPRWPLLTYFMLTEIGLAILGYALLSTDLPWWIG